MRLADYIEENGLRKDWFAEKIGVTASTISLWINGRRKPSYAYIYMICQKTNGLVGESDWEIEPTIHKSAEQDKHTIHKIEE